MSGGSAAVPVDRRVFVPSESEPSQSEVAARAERSSPGAWTEGLSAWGVREWQLPGQGESGAGCGEWYPDAVCETCGVVDLAARSCGRRSCPDCWGIWAHDAAIRATVRIQAFRYTQPDDWHRQVAHAIVAPPEAEVMSERQYWDGRSKAAEMALEKGFRGCAVIPHPYRVTEEGKEQYQREDPDYGIWVWLRNDVDGMDRYTYWSPHYHVIGPTGADMDPAVESDEWVYHFRRSVEPFSGVRDYESHEDVYGLFRYLLSHTGYPAESTKQVTTWYGDLANSVFVEDATEEWQHAKPSDGVLSALERAVEEVAGVSSDDDKSDERAVREESGDKGPCPVDECDGKLIDVFDVLAYLRQVHPEDRPREGVEERMRAAREWRLGRIEPPPGMKRPRTEQQAREAFEALLE